MSQQDQQKWDKKYQETPKLLQQRDPSCKLQELIKKIKLPALALDVACGAGKNAIYMAKKGLQVDALDISKVALQNLEAQKYSNIHTQLIDLDEYTPPKEQYDIIVKTNFLDRQLIPKLTTALKSKGYFYIETYMQDKINEKPPSNPEFLLQKEELKSFFGTGFRLIEYDEFENEPEELYRMKKQSIIVKKL